MIWYPVPEFRNDGFSEPKTWNELIAISDRLVRQGSTPWCMGWESGTATGWPGTDWIESLLLKDAGTEVYDDWTFHRLPFDSPSVREAFGRLGRILFTSGYVADGAIESPWSQAQLPMINQHGPGCWLYHFPDFARIPLPSSAAGTSTDFFPFPSIGPDRNALIGGGSIMSVFSDRPEVRELVRYILSPEYGTTLIGGSTPFHLGEPAIRRIPLLSVRETRGRARQRRPCHRHLPLRRLRPHAARDRIRALLGRDDAVREGRARQPRRHPCRARRRLARRRVTPSPSPSEAPLLRPRSRARTRHRAGRDRCRGSVRSGSSFRAPTP